MREAIICKVEGDDEYYHLVPQPGYIDERYSTEHIERSADLKTYCDKKVSALPHEWCYAIPWSIRNPYNVDFTWSHLKPCPKCEKNREKAERDAWGY